MKSNHLVQLPQNERINNTGNLPQIPSLIYQNELPVFPRFKKYIIDTDAGGDDAHAIILAFHIISTYRQDAEIIGITAVAGNACIENVIKNVTIALKTNSLENTTSIYKGCHNDSLRFSYRDDFFLMDGLGGVQEKHLKHFDIHEKKLEELHEKTHAVDFIYESALKYGEDLCIICLGPLTNIFLANQLYPQLPTLIGGICVMGGTYLSIGNTTNGCGEFNFLTDAEAAAAVLKAPYKFLSILPFDLSLGLVLEDHHVTSIFKNSQDTNKSRLIHGIFEQVYAQDPFCLCDQLCVLLALMPELITHGFKRVATICKDGYARGQMIIDWLGKMKNHQLRCIVTGVDAEKVFKIVSEANH